MSAHLVSKRSIHALVYLMFHKSGLARDGKITFYYSEGEVQSLTPNELGQLLVKQNYASVNARYHEHQEPYRYEHDPRDTFFDKQPMDFLVLCDYYRYQSCETPGYFRNSVPFQIVHCIREVAIKQLPGYSDCAWGCW